MAGIAVYCSRELFPIPVTYVYIIYATINDMSRSKIQHVCTSLVPRPHTRDETSLDLYRPRIKYHN